MYWETGMEGWILAPATEYLEVRRTCGALATLWFGVADNCQWSVERVNKMLEETRTTLAERKQHVYYYVYVDDRFHLLLNVADLFYRVFIYAKKP
jgi:hypothetical protein